MYKRSNHESSKSARNWVFNMRPRRMKDECTSIYKVGQQLCHHKDHTEEVNIKVVSNTEVSNMADNSTEDKLKELGVASNKINKAATPANNKTTRTTTKTRSWRSWRRSSYQRYSRSWTDAVWLCRWYLGLGYNTGGMHLSMEFLVRPQHWSCIERPGYVYELFRIGIYQVLRSTDRMLN